MEPSHLFVEVTTNPNNSVEHRISMLTSRQYHTAYHLDQCSQGIGFPGVRDTTLFYFLSGEELL